MPVLAAAVEEGAAIRYVPVGRIDLAFLAVPRDAVALEVAARRSLPSVGGNGQPAVPGNYVSGRLVGSTQLFSGRFAMIDDGLGFSLVPWRPTLEQHIGRQISGIAMPGGDVDWSFGRNRGLGL